MDISTDFLLNLFQQKFGSIKGVHIVCSPGRVNLIGEHTDYNEGFVLPMTIDKAVYVALRKQDNSLIHFHSINFEEDIVFKVNQIPSIKQSHWSTFLIGVIAELNQYNFINQEGVEGIIFGDVPIGSGLSSSAAVEMALAFAFQSVLGFQLEPVPMIRLCQKVEHEYVGVKCGIMDQFTARLGKKNHALFLDCRTLEYKLVPLSFNNVSIVIVDTNVQRKLDESKYNERRTECEQGVRYFQRIDSSITALRDVTLDLCEKHQQKMPEIIFNRCFHVVSENERVQDAVKYLQQGELKKFGFLMNESHASLRDLYEVSCSELDFLVNLAQKIDGVLGARMTGAGFGGCTVNLIENRSVINFIQSVEYEYQKKFNIKPTVYKLDSNKETGLIYNES